jgi:LPS sulfotransferase NodH
MVRSPASSTTTKWSPAMVSPVTCPDTYFDPRFSPFTENTCTEWLAWRKQTKYTAEQTQLYQCRTDTVIPLQNRHSYTTAEQTQLYHCRTDTVIPLQNRHSYTTAEQTQLYHCRTDTVIPLQNRHSYTTAEQTQLYHCRTDTVIPVKERIVWQREQ